MALPGQSTSPGRTLKWTCEQVGEEQVLRLSGDMDENANLFEIKAAVSGRVRIDLGGVKRINSAGVRDWVNFTREVEEITDHLTLDNCSPAIVMQMNMIANFRGHADVASIFAPLACPQCDHEQDGRIELSPDIMAALPDTIPEFRCDQCNEILELDDIPERYFAFLKLQTNP